MSKPSPIDPDNPQSYVVCQVCGEKRRRITTQHINSHGVTLVEYQEAFPGSPLTSSHRLQKNREQFKRQWADPVWRAKMEDHLTRTREEFLSDPENIKRRNESISASHLGMIRSEDHVEATREAAERVWEERFKNPDELAAWNEARIEGQRNSDEWKEANKAHLDEVRPTPEEQSYRMTLAIKNGEITPHYYSVPTVYKGVQMRSRAEATFAERMDKVGLIWHYEPTIITLPDGRSYLPDFYVDGLEMYFEIKGFDNGENTEKALLAGVTVVTVAEMRQWN